MIIVFSCCLQLLLHVPICFNCFPPLRARLPSIDSAVASTRNLLQGLMPDRKPRASTGPSYTAPRAPRPGVAWTNNRFSALRRFFLAFATVDGRKFALHPCNKTLNSRNLGFAKDSFKVSFGFRTPWMPCLIKDPKNVKNRWFYCVFAQKY